jgi:hypothetical protein
MPTKVDMKSELNCERLIEQIMIDQRTNNVSITGDLILSPLKTYLKNTEVDIKQLKINNKLNSLLLFKPLHQYTYRMF